MKIKTTYNGSSDAEAIATGCGVIGLFFLKVWIVMLLLGALAVGINEPAFAIGYWDTALVVLIAGFLLPTRPIETKSD